MKEKILKCICLVILSGVEIIAVAVNLFMLYASVAVFNTAILFNVILIPIIGIIGFSVTVKSRN